MILDSLVLMDKFRCSSSQAQSASNRLAICSSEISAIASASSGTGGPGGGFRGLTTALGVKVGGPGGVFGKLTTVPAAHWRRGRALAVPRPAVATHSPFAAWTLGVPRPAVATGRGRPAVRCMRVATSSGRILGVVVEDSWNLNIIYLPGPSTRTKVFRMGKLALVC